MGSGRHAAVPNGLRGRNQGSGGMDLESEVVARASGLRWCRQPSRLAFTFTDQAMLQPSKPKARRHAARWKLAPPLGFMNHPFLETPNLDSLARNGVHLKNAFVTTALCSPSRASILTGLYAHRHRVVDNNNAIQKGTVFFSRP